MGEVRGPLGLPFVFVRSTDHVQKHGSGEPCVNDKVTVVLMNPYKVMKR